MSQDLKPFSLNHETKMSRESLESMLQIFTAQLKAILNAAYRVVDDACTFLMGDGLNLLTSMQQQCESCPVTHCL